NFARSIFFQRYLSLGRYQARSRREFLHQDFFTQTIEFIEIDAGMITIVIGEGDIDDPFDLRRIDPGLQERLSVMLDPVALRVTVVIGEKNWGVGGLE